MDPQPLQLVILISGRGSNMTAIHDACTSGRLNAKILAVIADRSNAAGLEIAKSRGLAADLVSFRGYPTRTEFEQALAARIDAKFGAATGARQGVLVLAGFMRILGAEFVRHYRGRMLNIHPSLLPAYRGLNTHARALAAGDSWHGASVHFVSDELDSGPVAAQLRVPVMSGDTVETLSARVQRGEHRLYWRVLQWIAQNRLSWDEQSLRLDGRILKTPQLWQLPEPDVAGEVVDAVG